MPEVAALTIAVEADVNRADRSLQQIGQRARDAQGRFVSLDKSAKSLKGGFETAAHGASRFGRDLETAGKKADQSKGAFSGLAGTIRGLTSVLNGSQIGGGSLLSSLANISEIIQGIPQIGNLAAALTRPFIDATKRGLEFNMMLETAQIGFEGVAGSADKARAHIQALQKFGERTPFEFPGLLSASRLMTTFGFGLDEQIPKLTVWGDAVAASGNISAESISGVVRAFGQMRALGRVNAEEMNQLAERGIPAWELLAKAIGKSVAETRKLGERGKLDGAASVEAITAMLGRDPRFAGMMKRMEGTLQGRLSAAQDVRSFAEARATSQLATDISGTLGEALKQGNLAGELGDKINAAITPVSGIVKAAAAGLLGGGITSGLSEGIQAGMEQIGSQMPTWVATWLLDPFKKAVGMRSPSRVFRGYGVNLMLGLAQGIQDGDAVAQDATNETARKLQAEIEEIIRKRAAVRVAIDEAKRDMSRAGNMPDYLPVPSSGRVDPVPPGHGMSPTHDAANKQRETLWQGARQRVAALEDELKRLDERLRELSNALGSAVQAAGALNRSQGGQVSPPEVARPGDPSLVHEAGEGAYTGRRGSRPGDARRERDARGRAAVPDDNYFVRPVARGGAPDPPALPIFDHAQFHKQMLSMISLVPQLERIPEIGRETAAAFQQASDATGTWYDRVVTGSASLTERLQELKDTLPSLEDQLTDLVAGMPSQIGGIFGDAVREWDGSFDAFFDHVLEGFAGMLAQMSAQLAESAVTNLLTSLLTSVAGSAVGGWFKGAFGGGGGGNNLGLLGPGGGSGSGSTFGFFGPGSPSPIGGFRAEGGPVDAGTAYVVGERGPEIVMPRSAGTVVSNEQVRQALGGGQSSGGGGGREPITINFNVHGIRDTRGLKESMPQLARRMGRMIQAHWGD